MNLSNLQPYLTPQNLTIGLGVLSGLLFLISLILFSMYSLQKKRKRDIQLALRSRLQATYNQFYQIALASDRIREFNLSSVKMEEKIPLAMIQASFISGIANSARSDIISYTREHLRFVPVWEDPNQPHKGKLPVAKRNNKVSNQNGLPSIAEPPRSKAEIPPPPKLDL
jgi:hypothetical protein